MNDSNLQKHSEIKYDGSVDLSVKNNSHTLAFYLIHNDSNNKRKKILDVGCSAGYFGFILKRYGHEVWGIELDEISAKKAKELLDYVYVESIEIFLNRAIENNFKFDYIVFGDVLEHLVDAQSVLKKCKDILADDGAIVSSIPNVAHFAVRLMLLEGRWEYSKLGIMDETHLRFYTKKSIVETFVNSGYVVENILPVRVPVLNTGIQVNEKLKKSVYSLIDHFDIDVFQYVSLARKGKNSSALSKTLWWENNSTRVLCLLPDEMSSLAEIRILGPLRVWAKENNGLIIFKNIYDFSDEDLIWPDVVIMQREANAYILSIIYYLKYIGKKVVFDIDDLLTDVPPFLKSSDHHRYTKKSLLRAIRISDQVTVTNSRLKQELTPVSSKIKIIPNCSYPYKEISSDVESYSDDITFIIASSDSVVVEEVLPALLRICRDYPDVKIVCIGEISNSLINYGIKCDAYDCMEYKKFKSFISSMKNGVGIIPLDSSKFSSCKSEIKFIDYSLAGIASICSNTPPYSDIIVSGETGILVDDEDGWYDSMAYLIENHERRREIVGAAHRYVTNNYSMSKASKLWSEVFSELKIVRDRNCKRVHTFSQYKKRNFIKLICLILSDKYTYVNAYSIFNNQGIVGVVKKIKRILM